MVKAGAIVFLIGLALVIFKDGLLWSALGYLVMAVSVSILLAAGEWKDKKRDDKLKDALLREVESRQRGIK